MDWVSCISNPCELDENMYAFRAPVGSALILQAWPQQVDLVLQPQFGDHQQGEKGGEFGMSILREGKWPGSHGIIQR